MSAHGNGGRAQAPGPRGPAAVYCVLTVALIVLLATFAYDARQPAPPQIAELTPQAQHQITRAPHQLRSSLGSAFGGPGGAAGTTTTTSSSQATTTTSGSPPIGPTLAEAHHCFGDPPRQVSFDTQSPPCVAYWAGDNGGATSQGVTGTTINIPFTVPGLGKNIYVPRVMADLQTFFNDTFELYGRKVNLLPEGAGEAGGSCAAGESLADGLATQDRPFAAGDPAQPGTSGREGDTCFIEELARDHVIATVFNPLFARSDLRALAPYVYQYPMAYDEMYANTGAFICSQLAGHAASYSTDPVLARETRKFGLIALYAPSNYPYQTGALAQQLASCGSPLVATEVTDSPSQSWATNAILKLQRAGATTVVCVCGWYDANNDSQNYVTAAASTQGYYPEWIALDGESLLSQDLTFRASWDQPDQENSVMGLTFEPAQVPYPMTTLNQALNAVDPGYQVDEVLEQEYKQWAYWELLVLFSGIQMAGPDLTPYSFERGLQEAHFPNPFSPEMEGIAGFAGNSEAMTEDAALMWWGPNAATPYPDDGAPGAWCYADGGRRFALGTWPTAPIPLFTPVCDATPPGS